MYERRPGLQLQKERMYFGINSEQQYGFELFQRLKECLLAG